MKLWKLIAPLLLGILACTSGTSAQEMFPNYIYTQDLYWLPSPATATQMQVGIEVNGTTECYPMTCPVGATHHYDLVAGLGTAGGECVGPNVDPSYDLGGTCTVQYSLPFWDVHGSVYGEVICSKVGTISADTGGTEDVYWENQDTFVKAVANSLNITTDCTYPNDTSPDWVYNTNPYGTQGGTPNPAIIEEMRLAYTSNSSGYGPFTPFPNGIDEFSGTAMVYGPWSGSMPQKCTQHASGKTIFTPRGL
jgi:hypothetical protein